MCLDAAKSDVQHLHDFQQIVAKSDLTQVVYRPLCKHYVDFAVTFLGYHNDRPQDARAESLFILA